MQTLSWQNWVQVVVDVVMGAQAQGPDREALVRKGQGAGDAVVAVLSAQADVVETMVPRCLDDVDIEALHDLRVAIRRSRSVLRQMRQVMPAETHKQRAGDLRWVQAVTGPTRDLDVLLERWSGLVDAVSAEAQDVAALDRDRLVARRAEEFGTMAAALRGQPFTERWTAWQAYLAAAPDRASRDMPIEQLAARRIDRANRRLRKRSVGIDATSPATKLHDLRKRGKELRYLLELFGETCLPGEVVQLGVRRLKDLQDVLGRHQDDEVHRGLIRSVLEPGTAADAVISLLEADKVEARQDLASALEALDASTAEVSRDHRCR